MSKFIIQIIRKLLVKNFLYLHFLVKNDALTFKYLNDHKKNWTENSLFII